MNERELNIGIKSKTIVVCVDDPGPGGACHEYYIRMPNSEMSAIGISFQMGPIEEEGAYGCQNEDLLAIVIDRLRGFQTGKFSCRENAIALTKLEESLMWLNKRTRDRIKRGVEGKNIK